MKDREYTTSKDQGAGFQLLCDTLLKEARKYRLKALLTTDETTRLGYEVKSLEAKMHVIKIMRGEKEKGSKGTLRKALHELSQKYEILSTCTNDPEKRAEYKRKSEQYKKDGKGI